MKQHKNKLLRSFVNKIRDRSPRMPDSFLIVSTTGLGDTLWGTPAIRSLRESFPNSRIEVLTSPIGKTVLEGNPHIDGLHIWQGNALCASLRLCRILKQRKFHTIFIFHASQRAVLPFCASLGPERIIATEGLQKGLDDLLTLAIPQEKEHEILRRLKCISAIGAENFSAHMEIFPSPQEKARIEAFLQPYLTANVPIICMHPGARDLFKRWPKENFIELGNMLTNHLGCQLLITGNHQEKELTESIAHAIPSARSLAGMFSTRELAALYSKAHLFITNDTGPMHIAFAVQAPTVALFCATDHKLCGPYLSSRSHVIQKKITCGPCLKKRCREPFCMLQIGPDEVFEKALDLYYA